MARSIAANFTGQREGHPSAVMHEAMKLCYDSPMTDISASQYETSLGAYIDQGMQTAESLGNRGPIRFDAEGKLAPDILEAYWRTGFYVFEGLIDSGEIQLLREEMESLLDRAPIDNGATVDHQGRPAFGQQFARSVYLSLIHI